MLEGLTTDDAILVLGILAVLVPLGIWGARKYQQLKADGKLELGEVLDAVEEAVDKVEEAKDEIDELIEEREAKKESEKDDDKE